MKIFVELTIKAQKVISRCTAAL